MKKTVGIIGGDLRQKYLADAFQMPIVFFANESIQDNEKVFKCHNLDTFFLESDIIVVPIPFSRDQKNIFTKYFIEQVTIDSFLTHLTKAHLIIGGPFSISETRKIKDQGTKIIDITALETFKLMNAIPTAEGVISEIIIKLDQTIHKSNALILGYGYCGKRIAQSIKCLGGNLEVYTENNLEKRAVISDGYQLSEINPIKNYDYIINTIPKVLISQESINSKMLFIDITEAYNWEGNDVFIKMRGIPGRFSPRTAGVIISELLYDLIINVTGENG